MNNASDVVVEKLGFEFDAIDRFGGVAIYGSKRVIVRHCRFVDSAPTPLQSFDRMGLMGMAARTM